MRRGNRSKESMMLRCFGCATPLTQDAVAETVERDDVHKEGELGKEGRRTIEIAVSAESQVCSVNSVAFSILKITSNGLRSMAPTLLPC